MLADRIGYQTCSVRLSGDLAGNSKTWPRSEYRWCALVGKQVGRNTANTKLLPYTYGGAFGCVEARGAL